MNEQQLEHLRTYYDKNDTSSLMSEAERVDLGDFTGSDATVGVTVSMPHRVLDIARETAAAEGVPVNDVLRRFVEVGADTRGAREATIPVSKLLRLIEEARGA